MKKKIPISKYKYNNHMSKFGRYFFGDRRRSNVMSSPKFYANKFDQASAFYRGLDRFDYDHTIEKVNLSTVLQTLDRFIELPEMPKTYLSKKKSNDYTINRHSTKTAYFDFDTEKLNYIADNYKAEYEKAWNSTVNKGSFHNYMHRNMLRKENVYYSVNLRKYYDGGTMYSPIKFDLYDSDHIRTLKENLLNIRLNDLLYFTIETIKEICVSTFNDFSFANKEEYYRPISWYDDSEKSKQFLDTYLQDASRNATIVQCSYEIILRTVNFKSFKHNIPFPPSDKKEYEPLNYLSLSYYFYEIADYKEYI